MQGGISIATSKAVVHHRPQRALVDDAVSQHLCVLALQSEAHEAAHQRVRARLSAAHGGRRVGAHHVAHVLFVSKNRK